MRAAVFVNPQKRQGTRGDRQSPLTDSSGNGAHDLEESRSTARVVVRTGLVVIEMSDEHDLLLWPRGAGDFSHQRFDRVFRKGRLHLNADDDLLIAQHLFQLCRRPWRYVDCEWSELIIIGKAVIRDDIGMLLGMVMGRDISRNQTYRASFQGKPVCLGRMRIAEDNAPFYIELIVVGLLVASRYVCQRSRYVVRE